MKRHTWTGLISILALTACTESSEERADHRREAAEVARAALEKANGDDSVQYFLRQAAGLEQKRLMIERARDSYASGGGFSSGGFFARATGADDAGRFAAQTAANEDLRRVDRERARLIQNALSTQLKVARKSLSSSERSQVEQYLPEFLEEKRDLRSVEQVLEQILGSVR
ncbi:MAG: hypothetical protein RL885_14030 [Planctomycetota bacterium]